MYVSPKPLPSCAGPPKDRLIASRAVRLIGTEDSLAPGDDQANQPSFLNHNRRLAHRTRLDLLPSSSGRRPKEAIDGSRAIAPKWPARSVSATLTRSKPSRGYSFRNASATSTFPRASSRSRLEALSPLIPVTCPWMNPCSSLFTVAGTTSTRSSASILLPSPAGTKTMTLYDGSDLAVPLCVLEV